MALHHTPGQHPALARMRPAQDRAMLILDTEHGAVTPTAPTPATTADRDSLELAYRNGARTLLDHDARVWLEWAEQAQTMRAYGQDPLAEEPERPSLTELHDLVTLAHAVQVGPVVPPEPIKGPDEEPTED